MTDDFDRRRDAARRPNRETPTQTHSPSTRRRTALYGATAPERQNARGPQPETAPPPLYGRIGAPEHLEAEAARREAQRPLIAVRPSLRTAPAVVGLILAMIAIEGLLTLADVAGGSFGTVRPTVYDVFAFSPIEAYRTLVGDGDARGFYGLFGHMLLHDGLLHIGMNLAFMALIGPSVERDSGARGALLIFVSSGLGGALGHALWQVGVMAATPAIGVRALEVGLVGASGAISGLLGAEIWRRAGALRAISAESRTLSPNRFVWNATSGFVVVNLLISFSAANISGAAHIGGYVAGMAAAAALGLGDRPARASRRH